MGYLEMSAHMMGLKAVAPVSAAYRIGAIMAGAEDSVVELLAHLGNELGSIGQLVNDVDGILPRNTGSDDGQADAPDLPPPKSDLRRRKRTLPIVFVLRDDSPEPNAVQRAFRGPAEETVDEDELRRTVVTAGGVQFANLLAQVHLHNALEALEQLEALRPGAKAILAPLIPTAPDPAPQGR